jgi:hypothetical protein
MTNLDISDASISIAERGHVGERAWREVPAPAGPPALRLVGPFEDNEATRYALGQWET